MHLTLHLTARCNLRCRYCYEAPHAGGDMTFATVQAAIRLALESHAREKPGHSLGVIFFGGEPLLQRDLIVRTVRWCRAIQADTGQAFHFKMTTNGTLLDEAFFTESETRDIFIALSHDGVQAAHDAHRIDAAGNGSFTRLSPLVDLLLKHKPYAPVMAVVTPETVSSYAAAVDYLYGRGFRYLIFTLNYGAQWNDRHLRELKRQYARIADWYFDRTMAEEKFYFSPFEVKIASHVFPDSCRGERCELGQQQISIAPNGCIYPCVQFVGDGNDLTWAIGHVATGIDEGARARLMAMTAVENADCAGCAIRERCNHYCGCLNKQVTGRPDSVAPLLCAHERIVLPIADKLAARLFARRNPLFIQKHYNEFYPLVSLVEDRAPSRQE